jgi:hypothetical protein
MHRRSGHRAAHHGAQEVIGLSPALKKLARAADERFPKLVGHGERTASYAVAAAQHFGVPQQRLIALRIAAALHYAWSESGDCPCCEPGGVALTRWTLSEAPPAADLVRAMRADWNMASPEASALAAACQFDLARLGIELKPVEYRPGNSDALRAVAPLITPLDRADV